VSDLITMGMLGMGPLKDVFHPRRDSDLPFKGGDDEDDEEPRRRNRRKESNVRRVKKARRKKA